MKTWMVLILFLIFFVQGALAQPPGHAQGRGKAPRAAAVHEEKDFSDRLGEEIVDTMADEMLGEEESPSGMPPGLAKKDKMPPGLAKQDKVPPGWGKGEKEGWNGAGNKPESPLRRAIRKLFRGEAPSE
ncbi:MAG: hypothetical protein HYY14_00960 [Candidatus Omnitrophica bacterium]|nr:hypothetical protein [Candidatus Omnitrophota bacterium]